LQHFTLSIRESGAAVIHTGNIFEKL